MKEIQICLISGDGFQDKFFHHADLFEQQKMLATPQLFTATCEDQTDPVLVCEKMKEAAIQYGKVVAACFIPGTNIGYVNPDVVLVSNGTQFSALEYWLNYYGYQPVEALS